MGRGNFKGKPQRGERKISDMDEIRMREEAEERRMRESEMVEEEEESSSEEEESGNSESDDEALKVENPNWGRDKSKKGTMKAKDADMEKTTELSRREREELEKQMAQRRYESGKTERARKDLERLTLLRQQREDAAKKRQEEKAAREENNKKKELLRAK